MSKGVAAGETRDLQQSLGRSAHDQTTIAIHRATADHPHPSGMSPGAGALILNNRNQISQGPGMTRRSLTGPRRSPA